MRKLFNLLVLVLLAVKVFPQWSQCNGPYGGHIDYLAQNEKTNTVFAVSVSGQHNDQGIYRYKTSEGSWENITSKFPSVEFDGVAALDSVIFVSNSIYGLFKSVDDGDSWTKVTIDSNSIWGDIATMVNSKGNNLMVYFGYSFYVTNDCFLFKKISSDSIADLSHSVYMGIQDGRVFISYSDTNSNLAIAYSDDFGQTWQKPVTDFSYTQYTSSANSNTFYFFGDRIFFGANLYSDDFGVNWNRINFSPLNMPYITTNAIYNSNDTLILGNNYHDRNSYFIYNHWTSYTTVSPNPFSSMKANQFSLCKGIGLLAATDYGVFSSHDGGYTWSSLNNGLYSLTPNFLTRYKNHLIVGLSNTELYSSGNKGSSWISRNCGLENESYGSEIMGMATHKDSLLVTSYYHGIFVSKDGGKTWVNRGNSSNEQFQFTNMSSDGEKVYGLFLGSAIVESNDGVDWYYTYQAPCEPMNLAVRNGLIASYEWCYHGHFDPSTSDLLVSSDSGATFSRQNASVTNSIAILNNTIVSAGGKFFVKSDNYGITWQIDSSFAPYYLNSIYTIEPDFIFTGTREGKIFFSNDKGQTWSDVTGNLNQVPLQFYYLSNTLYITTTHAGIWKLDVSNLAIPDNSVANDPPDPTDSTSIYGVFIYPNPSNGRFSIVAQDDIQAVQITNVLGQLILSETPNNSALNVQVDRKGVYFVSVTVGDKKTTSKIVVAK